MFLIHRVSAEPINLRFRTLNIVLYQQIGAYMTLINTTTARRQSQLKRCPVH